MAKMTEAEAKAFEERRQLRRARAMRALLTLPLNQIAQANQYTSTSAWDCRGGGWCGMRCTRTGHVLAPKSKSPSHC